MKKIHHWMLSRRLMIGSLSVFIFSALVNVTCAQDIPGGKKFNVTTRFPGGGGRIEKIDHRTKTIYFKPHNENDGGWSQVWWYFRTDGILAGDTITLMLNQADPAGEGVTPRAYFSTDRKTWKMTAPGKEVFENGTRYFVYKQQVSENEVWFAYNIPYLQEQVTELENRCKNLGKQAEIQTLCRSNEGRPVSLIKLIHTDPKEKKPFQIWLQARAHAFESGSSRVVHELVLWLMSEDSNARKLRSRADITIVPIVDVDGVFEGRTGKNRPPHDHNRDWETEPPQWPEVDAMKKRLKELATDNQPDLFIDTHGPANQSHPYFIAALPNLLRNDVQRANQAAFLSCFENAAMNKEVEKSQSMHRFFYSLRELNHRNAAGWAVLNTSAAVVSVTLEVNMNTPLSTAEGYQLEARALGLGVARYFAQK